MTSDERKELEEVIQINSDSISSDERKKILNLLPNELWRASCNVCNKPVVRLFEPRISKIHTKKRMKSKDKGKSLIETPSFNMIIAGTHSSPDEFNLGNRKSGTYSGWGSCSNTCTVVKDPKPIVLHFLSRLAVIKTACIINGVTYQEFKDWFNSLSDTSVTGLLPNVLTFQQVPNFPEIADHPWWLLWIHSKEINTVTVLPPEIESLIGPGLGWDRFDININWTSYSTDKFEYGIFAGSDYNNTIADISYRGLEPWYIGARVYYITVEPKLMPGKYMWIRTSVPIELRSESTLFNALNLSGMPREFFEIKNDRILPAVRPGSKDDPSYIYRD